MRPATHQRGIGAYPVLTKAQARAARERRALTKVELRRALALIGRGESRREAARRLGVSHTTLNRWLRRIDTALERVAGEAETKAGTAGGRKT